MRRASLLIFAGALMAISMAIGGCRITVVEDLCGDGILDVGEECDDGNNRNGDGCSSGCFLEGGCGDAILDPGEDCDDGNLIDGDGCSSACTAESTGYLVCDAPADCNGRDMCFDIVVPEESTQGSVCTHTCAGDGECMAANGFTGACFSLAGSQAVCYQRCDMQSDCFVANVCISVTLPSGILDGICVPNNG